MMQERPSLSISVGRRPSLLAAATANASGTSIPSSPSSFGPLTPLNHSPAFDGYFLEPLQTPPLNGGNSNSLFPPSIFPGRRNLLRRNSSLSSVSSSVADDDDDEDEPEWTHKEEEQVQRIYDSCLAKHSRTEAPFASNGPPPPNFTNMVARAVLRSQNAPGRVTRAVTRTSRSSSTAKKPTFFSGSSDDGESDNDNDDGMDEEVSGSASEVEMDAPAPKFRHGLKSTRQKIIAMARERQSAEVEATPRQVDPDATPKRRKPMVRQDSMDFLPDMRNASSISRLSNMLRQPTGDLSAPSMAISRSGSGTSTPPCAPSAFFPSHSQGARSRVQRTNSLQSIAGSPSQPKTVAAKRPVVASTAATASLDVPMSTGLKRMTRVGSESSVLSAPTLARTLSFDPNKRAVARPPLGTSSKSDPVAPPPSSAADSLSTPPPSAAKKPHGSFFDFLNSSPTRPKAQPTPSTSPRKAKNPNLHLDANAGASFGLCLKRPQGGLASAFHSPVVGVYPSPTSASPKKKKVKTAAVKALPVAPRQPAFLAPPRDDPFAAGLGLGLGLGLGGLELGSSGSAGEEGAFSSGGEESGMMDVDSVFSSSGGRTNRATLGASASYTLLDPPALPSSSSGFSSRRASQPPKLTLTPSLSPSSSSSSLSSAAVLSPRCDDDFLDTSSCSATRTDAGTGTDSFPSTPSPLSPAFDLNDLNLETLSSPAMVMGQGQYTASPMSGLQMEGEGGGGGKEFSFLPKEYVAAGREAQALRDAFNGFSWRS